MNTYKDYWFETEAGLLYSANYKYSIQQNIITDKYKVIFTGTKDWNKTAKVVRYYDTKPSDKNICLTVRSI